MSLHIQRYQALLEQIKQQWLQSKETNLLTSQSKPPSLCVVSKNQSAETIHELYLTGCRDFAENRLQPFLIKKQQLDNIGAKDIKWHFIGHLQSNKLAKLVGQVDFFHSVDTFILALKLDHYALTKKIKVKIFLQVNISGETSKQGLGPDEWRSHLAILKELEGVQIVGLMTMAPYDCEPLALMSFFSKMKELSLEFNKVLPQCTELSMGMSQDYQKAIDAGSTMLRLGSALFQ
jgi:pyridoxal phosphate enzyme (YggS family)